MEGKPHGRFVQRWSGEILVQRLAGTLNREGAVAWCDAIEGRWVERGKPDRWGVLNDFRMWEGATPEAFVVLSECVNLMRKRGVIAAARVTSDHFLPKVADRGLGQVAHELPVQVFQHVDDAWQWLAAFGLEAGDQAELDCWFELPFS